MQQINVLNKKNIVVNIRFIVLAVFLFIVSVSARIAYFTSLRIIITYPDSREYIRAANNLGSFRIDISRMPLYPMFIQAARHIFPYMGIEAAVILSQMFLSSAAAIIIFYLSSGLFKSYFKSFAFSLFCSVNIFLLNWDFFILTESLTIILILLLVFSFNLYIKKGSGKFMVLTCLISLLLIFIKPFYVLLPVPVFALFLICSLFTGRKKQIFVIGILSLFFTYSCLFLYSYVNFMQNGCFGSSEVASINRLGKVLQYRMYGLGDDKSIKKLIEREIESNNGKLPDPKDFIYKYSLNANNFKEISAFTNNIIKKHPIMYAEKTMDFILHDLVWRKAFADYNEMAKNYKPGVLSSLFYTLNKYPVINTFLFVFFFIFAEVIYIIYQIFKNHRCDWIWIFIDIIILYQLFMSIAASHGEYARLMAPVYVLIFMIIWKPFYSFKGHKILDTREILDVDKVLDTREIFISSTIIKIIKTVLVHQNDSLAVQFFRYLIVGGVASIIDISVFHILTNVFHIYHIESNTISFICGLLFNYFLSRGWVFNKQMHSFARDFTLFTVIGVLGLMLSNLILYILIDLRVLYGILAFIGDGMVKLAAKLIAVFIVLFWNFIARKKIVFKNR